MPFNSDILQDASLQQAGEDLQVWETGSRFTPRQDSLAGGHVQFYHRVKEENDQDELYLHRNHVHGVDRLRPVKVEQEEMYEPVDNPDHVREGHRLQISEDSSQFGAGGPPTWLSTAALRQPNQSLKDREIRGRAGRETTTTVASLSHVRGRAGRETSATFTHWLLVQGTSVSASSSQYRPLEEHGRKANDQSDLGINIRQHTRMATELNLTVAHGRSPQPSLVPGPSHPPAAASRSYPHKADRGTATQDPEWEEKRNRCLIVTHPLFPQVLARHAACLRVGTPVEQLPGIEAQLAAASDVTEKYRVLRDQITDVTPEEQAELDRHMIEHQLALGSLEERLQHHVYTDVTEAMMSCWDIEQELYNLTGARPVQGYGATMSDDDNEDYDSDYGSYDMGMDCNDIGAYGPLEPSESERTLMERVRQELKQELKQGYTSKIADVREEILRKRRAGKLPEGTTAILKNWWDAHAKWPYPTEDEKEILIQRTGLELKQVNNWFINQRKRNWQGNPMNPNGQGIPMNSNGQGIPMNSNGQAVDPKGKVRKSW